MNANKQQVETLLQECSKGNFESSSLFKNIITSSETQKAVAVLYCKDYEGISFVDTTKERDANIELFKRSKEALNYLIELRNKLKDEHGITELGSVLKTAFPDFFTYLFEL